MADVIDLSARRRARGAGTSRETALIDINTIKLRFMPDGGLEIVAHRVRGAEAREIAWGLDRNAARAVAQKVECLYLQTNRATLHAEHPELAPKPWKPPAFHVCGLNRNGGRGGRRGARCGRRQGHHGPHKDADGTWTMPCPCPGSKTRVTSPEGTRVGYAKCAWCGAERDTMGNVVRAAVREVPTPER